jgi:pyrimidine deaminase RibD-like protein/NTP pyrophosphatase (non-canonical NTP hydrolase)
METAPQVHDERHFMQLAIEEAKRCKSEDGRAHPRVGAVVVHNGVVLASGHRGELKPGEHAEYTVLERKLEDEIVAGAVVYTTLEPCTTRNHPKVPCADRLVARKVARVVIGMLDPNPQIRGTGQLKLREANIATEFFPADLMSKLEELNRDFTRAQRRQNEGAIVDRAFVEATAGRRLDEWYIAVNSIYWNRNFGRDASAILAHLVEVVGGLSCVASRKKKPGVDPNAFVAKAVAWWLALCGKLGVKSVEDMLWDKFPGVCPYCQRSKHDPDECREMKIQNLGPNWQRLAEIGKEYQRPNRLGDWQAMFSSIYPSDQVESAGATFARLTEELGELAEAVRVFSAEPGYFLSEAADVFAWLMHVQNALDSEKQVPKKDRGSGLEVSMCRAYPDSCTDCGQKVCSCPPILASTIGRIAHEVPAARGTFEPSGRFFTPDKARKLFSSLQE